MLLVFINLIFQIHEIVLRVYCIANTLFGAINVINLFIYACLVDGERNEKH